MGYHLTRDNRKKCHLLPIWHCSILRQKGWSFPRPLCWCSWLQLLSFRSPEHRSGIPSVSSRKVSLPQLLLLTAFPLSTDTVNSAPICSLHALVFLPGGPRHTDLWFALCLAIIPKCDFIHSQNSLAFLKVFHLENYPQEVHIAAAIGGVPSHKTVQRTVICSPTQYGDRCEVISNRVLTAGYQLPGSPIFFSACFSSSGWQLFRSRDHVCSLKDLKMKSTMSW